MSDIVRSDVLAPEADSGELVIGNRSSISNAAFRQPWHTRFGLSWSAGSVPVVLIVLIGAALGPGGLSVLTPGVLNAIDPIVPVAVAALGVLAGLEFTRPAAPNRWPLLGIASVESLLTAVIVAFGVWLVVPAPADIAGSSPWIVAIMAGLCASMSASLPDTDPDRLRPALIRMRNLDAAVPALAGAVILISLQTLSPLASLGLVIQASILALLVSTTAWLLLADTSTLTEQRVFSIAALLLVGGIADYLSLSALAGGLLAGLFWGYVGGVARDCIERDVGYLRHPLVVLMLLVAGAKTTLSVWIVILAGIYLLLRVAGKIAGGLLIPRIQGAAVSRFAGPTLLLPGVFGIAFALDATSMMDSSASAILAATVLGSIGSQLIAGLWPHAEVPE
jgi:hypothetical protein